ncbi:MAG TPA: DUF6504 family protein [Candidatus Eisenbacteria bacterium]|nr:DUF6504 family protein [Candidatus Eisenbacteria bacterium]
MKESLISESIEPVLEETAERPFLAGEPVLPAAFRWRGVEYRVETILESWKEYSPGTRQMPDRYLRKHWFHVRAHDGTEMKIYFERHVRSKGTERARWWLFTVVTY